MKKILLATVAAIGFAGAASAADLAVRPAPVYAPAFNWSGCYLGGYVGGAWNAENVKVFDANGYETDGVLPYDWWSYDTDSSFIGGGTVGCNWQPVGSAWVLGIEGEIGSIDIKGSAADPLSPGFDTIASAKYGDWYGMITGRLGYAWDRVLVYAKGGAAFVKTDLSVVDLCTDPNQIVCGNNAITATGSKDQTAWTIGGGLEYAFNWNWSLKAEYMYIGLDDVTTCGIDLNNDSFCFNHDLQGIHTAKIGLNYRFGAGAPVVARY